MGMEHHLTKKNKGNVKLISRQKVKLIKCISITLCVLFIGCQKVNIAEYDGNGEISDIGNNSISYGYKLEFDNIDFSKAFYKEYKISNFPKIAKTITFGISTESRYENIQESLPGVLSLIVADSKGEIIFDCSANLAKWTFAETYYTERKVYEHFIYFFDEQKSFIEAENQIDPIFLTVKYEPKTTKLRLKGTLLLKAGGYK